MDFAAGVRKIGGAMSAETGPVPRVLVATVAMGRSHLTEDAVHIVTAALSAAKFTVVRTVTVNREAQFIQLLISNVSNENQADAVILIGGTGFGPRDFTSEAVDTCVERRIEGFGEAYRRLLADDLRMGTSALLARATAGVFNQCVVFAVPRKPAELARVVERLIVPTLREAVHHASGRRTTADPAGPLSGAPEPPSPTSKAPPALSKPPSKLPPSE
jgi:molybdenum cofactor biosynthesis protein B